MKKLFLLLTALVMSLSATMYAVPYLPDAEDAASFYLFDDNGQISGRNNAPMATTSYTFSANSTDFATLIQKASNENFAPYYLFALQLKKSGNYPIVDLYLGWNSSNNQLVNYGAIICVSPNTYSVLTSATQTYQIDKRIFSNSTFVSRVRTSSSNSVQFSNGTIKIEPGRHGYPYISTTADLYKNNTTKYNITAGDSRALTTTYTSCRVATDEERGKAVLYATEGTNTMTLIFSLENFDANIGIPAGTYTIGTDVKGGAYDEDGYTRWTFTSGTITITKNTNNLSMTTSNLKGQSSGSNFNCSLKITNKTPNKTFTPIICDAGLIGGGSNSPYWPFKVVGQNGDNQSPYFYAQYAYLSDITSGSAIYWTPVDATNNKLVVNNSTLTTWKQGFIEVDYTEDYEVMELYTGIMGANGTFYYVYVASNQVSNANGTNGFSMDYDNSSAFSATFSGCAIDEENSNETLKMIYGTGEANNKVTNLFFWVDDTKDGVVPSGRYPVRSTCVPNTLLLGCITSEGYINGSFSANSDYSNTWAMRTGAIEVVNVNETYYISTSSLANSKNQSMTFTMGTAPKTLTFNSDANGSVSASFNATNWGKTITDYAEGTAYPFFTGQTIVLTPTPADGYEFDSWSGGSPTDNGNGTYSITIGAANVSLTANFRAATSSHTVTIAVDETNNYGTISTTSITDVPDGATISVNGNQITINNTTVTATPSTAIAQYTYTFSSWKNGSTVLTGNSNTVTDDITIKANFTRVTNTYTVTIAKNEDEWGTISATSVANVPYGKVITTGTGENANKVTINGTTVTATPAANDAQYSYAFSGWTNGAATVTGDMTVTANFTRTVNTYDITFKNADGTTLKKSDGTTDAVYSVAYGATPAYDGATPTKTADDAYTYTFNGWDNEIVAVTTAATYTATYSTTKVQYTLTWDVNGGNALTGTYTNGKIDWGTTITAPAAPTKAGYTFNGWDADNDGTADDVATTMPTNNVTYKALWNAVSSDLVLKDGVSTGQTDIDFDAFATTYNGQTMSSVTLNRTFTAGNWATLCLPFDVNESQLSSTGLLRNVYEFRYATGSADAGYSVTFHFRVATSMEAGRGYLVKGTNELAKKSSFTFEGTESDPIVIDLSADTKTDVNDLKGVNYYYDESVGSSEIAIVGVLRSGTLRAEGKKVMGLANNMIWYPHSSGNPMPAYRAYFYNPDASDAVMPRVRIVVEGEGTTELEVVDGELYDAGGNDRAPSKYIRNGVLIIERNGVRYDAQGKRL